MESMDFSWNNVVVGNGLGMALVGMTIVFAGLVSISAYIALLPKLLDVFHKLQKKAVAPAASPAVASSHDLEPEELAAVGYVMHAEQLRYADSDLRVTIPATKGARPAWSLSNKMRTFPSRATL